MNTFLIASLKINLYVHIRTKYIKVLELGAFLESPEVRGVFLNFLQVNSDQAATTIYILKIESNLLRSLLISSILCLNNLTSPSQSFNALICPLALIKEASEYSFSYISRHTYSGISSINLKFYEPSIYSTKEN